MKSLLLLPLLALSSSLYARTDTSRVPLSTAPPAEDDHWHFRFAPYGRVTAIDGDIRIGRLSAPVDISMSDTLDSLDMAFMGLFEASYDRWSLGVDFVYGKTSQDIGGGGRIFDSFRYEQKQWIITPTIAYRVIDKPGYHMDLLAGARITVLEAELTGRLVGPGEESASRDTDWVDPIVGIRGQADFSEKFFFRYNADIGGFGASSDLNWQAFVGFGMNVNRSVSSVLGYRAIGIDYEKGGFAMDTVSHGPVAGLEIRW